MTKKVLILQGLGVLLGPARRIPLQSCYKYIYIYAMAIPLSPKNVIMMSNMQIIISSKHELQSGQF